MTGPPPLLACPSGCVTEHVEDEHNTNPWVAAEAHLLFRRQVVLPDSVLVEVSVMHTEVWTSMTSHLGWQRAEHPLLRIWIGSDLITTRESSQAAGLARLAALVSAELGDAVGEAVRICQFKEP